MSYAVESLGLSIRRACRVVGMCRATSSYKSRRNGNDEALRAQIRGAGGAAAAIRLPQVTRHAETGEVGQQPQADGEDLRGRKAFSKAERRRRRAALIRVKLPASERFDRLLKPWLECEDFSKMLAKSEVLDSEPCRARTCDHLIKSHVDNFLDFRWFLKLEPAPELFSF